MKNFKKRQSHPEDAKTIANLNAELHEVRTQNELMQKEIEHLHANPPVNNDEGSLQNSAGGANPHVVVKIHDKWISFSSDILFLAKKILGFSENIIKTKTEKIQVDDFRKNLDNFENFLTMSKEDLQNLRLKSVVTG